MCILSKTGFFKLGWGSGQTWFLEGQSFALPTWSLICKNRTCCPAITQHATEVGDIPWQDGEGEKEQF